VRRMLACGMSVAVGTDNTLVSRTNINTELLRVAEVCELDRRAFQRLVLAGFKAAFYPGRYEAKRRFVRRAAERIEQLLGTVPKHAAGKKEAACGS